MRGMFGLLYTGDALKQPATLTTVSVAENMAQVLAEFDLSGQHGQHQ
jgi:hypothetical protein